MKLKKHRLHIHRILTFVMLWVFSLAITPWSALHHHKEVAQINAEKHCTHKFHVKTTEETCLVCKAHFEKNYTITGSSHITYLVSELILSNHPVFTSFYTQLISTSLRGPPILS